MNLSRLLVACLLLVLLLPAAAVAAPVSELAAEVVALRGEVEQLESDLARTRSRQEAELASLADRNAELEVLIQREELRLSTVRGRIEQQQRTSEQRDEASTALVPLLLDGVEALRAQVQGSLPHRLDDRLEELDELAEDLRRGSLDPHDAAARLLQFIEDELDLREGCGLDRQPVQLGEERMLARTIHVGMVALFIELEDGRHAMALPGEEPSLLEGEEARAARDLFDSFARQVRSGDFELPIPPPRRTP